MADLEVVLSTINVDLAVLVLEAAEKRYAELVELLVRARAVLNTTYSEIEEPTRQSVIRRLIEDISKVI